MVGVPYSPRAGRIDGPEKVTGAARYSADVRLPGLLVGVALRSPYPHARITSIDVEAARRMPGVHAVLTAADLPPLVLGKGIRDMPLLAGDRVRFVGEKVAVVAAESWEAAEEALGAIEVAYEELPAVFDVEAALKSDVPVLHPDRDSYAGPEPRELPPQPNASSRVVLAKGDVEAGFAQASSISEDVFHVPMQHVGFLEPHACTVGVDADGTLRVWSCVKQPFRVAKEMALATGLPADKVVVMPARIGGDFGGKGYIVDEALAYFLARATGRPVQMVMRRNEEFVAGIPRHAATIRMRSGLDGQGRLVARDITVLFNNGAYAAFRAGETLLGIRRAAGCYRIPHVRITALCVYTNQLPCGHMRAPGQPQVTFACESHTDLVARRAGLDPLEFRRRNVLRDGDEDPLGRIVQGVTASEVLERAARAVDWDRPRRDGQGRGLALGERGTGAGKAGAEVEVDADGGVLVRVGVPEVGTGAHTIVQQVVAHALTIDPDQVRVEQGDTLTGPLDPGSGGSHVTNITGGAARVAAETLRARLLELAAEAEGWREGSVTLEAGHFGSTGESARIPFAQLAGRLARLEGGLIREGADVEGSTGVSSGWACQAAEVTVDRETGQVRIDRVVAVHDVGYVLHPVGLGGQVEGGLIQGLGPAIMEELAVQDGRVQAVNFGEYKMPTIADVPPLEVDLLENRDGPAPFGGKGIGEITAVPIAAALANAVEDAVGVRIANLPITAEKVFDALQGALPGPTP